LNRQPKLPADYRSQPDSCVKREPAQRRRQRCCDKDANHVVKQEVQENLWPVVAAITDTA
jgi:hypothetical protein